MTVCEMCKSTASSITSEYTEKGDVITHNLCVEHIVDAALKYKDTYKYNKWWKK